jgi:hypothetical protein
MEVRALLLRVPLELLELGAELLDHARVAAVRQQLLAERRHLVRLLAQLLSQPVALLAQPGHLAGGVPLQPLVRTLQLAPFVDQLLLLLLGCHATGRGGKRVLTLTLRLAAFPRRKGERVVHPIKLRFIRHDDVPLVIGRARTGLRPALRLAGFAPLQRLQVCIGEDVERDAAALLEGGAQHLKEDCKLLEAASPLGDLFHICHARAAQVKPLVGAHSRKLVAVGSQVALKFPDHSSPLGCTSSSCTASAAALVERVSSYSFPCRNREVDDAILLATARRVRTSGRCTLSGTAGR